MQRRLPRRFLALACGLAIAATAAAAATDAPRRFKDWLDRYRRGRIDLHQPLKVPLRDAGGVRYYKKDATEELRRLLDDLVACDDLGSARLLMDAAVLRLDRRPAVELKRRVPQQPWLVRRLAREALYRFHDDGVAEWLARFVLRSRSGTDAVERASLAALVLANVAPDRVLEAVAPLSDASEPALRAAAARALGHISDPAALPILARLVRDADADVRLEALLGLERMPCDSDEVVSAKRSCAIETLRDPDWAVRQLAATMLSELPDPSSVPALIEALFLESPDREGSRRRVRTAIRRSLVALTGQDIPSTRPEDWRRWWESQRETFRLDEVLAEYVPEQGPRFFGIPLETDVVLFLIDVSGSMARPVSASGGPSRFFVATRELKRCVGDLDPGTRFDVIAFNERVEPMEGSPIPKDDASVDRVSAFLSDVDPQGGTDLYGALELALDLAPDPRRARAFDPGEIDTVVLLSDGTPSRGAVLQPDEILAQVTERNRRLRIAIHSVCARSDGSALLSELAARNLGVCTRIED